MYQGKYIQNTMKKVFQLNGNMGKLFSTTYRQLAQWHVGWEYRTYDAEQERKSTKRYFVCAQLLCKSFHYEAENNGYEQKQNNTAKNGRQKKDSRKIHN